MTATTSNRSSSKGNILVVMSGAHLLEMPDANVYATGYYLNELATPLRALIKAGYAPVFASPNGDAPTMDASSNDARFFGGDNTARMETLRYIRKGRSPELRMAVAKALCAHAIEVLGLHEDRLNVEFTQHSGDEMYHPALGGYSPEWRPDEVSQGSGAATTHGGVRPKPRR